ncbi:hypothetical protein DPMN_153696 [Dreissena polymorpha]|uniref:Uncharacterized protein n=1 Tax=Dreissena polymorpha TaxID=45954 RepID=A0A9D4FL96_DREPO|nr:hypothetical protein DPMN_153696 [Dreissena polymorpha]
MRPSDFSLDQHPFYLAIRTLDTAFLWFLRQQVCVNKQGQMLKAMAKKRRLSRAQENNESLSSQIPGSKIFEMQTFHPLKSWPQQGTKMSSP